LKPESHGLVFATAEPQRLVDRAHTTRLKPQCGPFCNSSIVIALAETAGLSNWVGFGRRRVGNVGDLELMSVALCRSHALSEARRACWAPNSTILAEKSVVFAR
jgi:hypothetical protein